MTYVLVEDYIEEVRQWYVSGVGKLCLECAAKGFTDFGSRLKQLRIHSLR